MVHSYIRAENETVLRGKRLRLWALSACLCAATFPVRADGNPVPAPAQPAVQSAPAAAPKDSGASPRPQDPSSGSEKTGPSPVPRSKPVRQRIHSVWVWQESKDCLWRLSEKYYGDPWQWKKIFLANRNHIVDPDVIFPKQKIVIPAQGE